MLPGPGPVAHDGPVDPADFPTLDPDLAPALAALPAATGSHDDLEAVEAARAGAAELAEAIEVDESGVAWEEVPEGRLYRPVPPDGGGPDGSAREVGGVLYVHGGGFCLGSAALEHATSVRLCRDVGAVVLTVDYRLAPEHPWPAGLEDCYAALRVLAGLPGVRPERVAVHGVSAGGGLAAALALLARDRGGPSIAVQSLVTPELDDRLETPSMRSDAMVPVWSRALGRRSWEHYLGGREPDQYAAPARATDLAGLPPAYVVACELDPLRDEAIAYGTRLLAAGVPVELHCFPGTFHGVQVAAGTPVVDRMDAELVTVLRRYLA